MQILSAYRQRKKKKLGGEFYHFLTTDRLLTHRKAHTNEIEHLASRSKKWVSVVA